MFSFSQCNKIVVLVSGGNKTGGLNCFDFFLAQGLKSTVFFKTKGLFGDCVVHNCFYASVSKKLKSLSQNINKYNLLKHFFFFGQQNQTLYYQPFRGHQQCYDPSGHKCLSVLEIPVLPV